MSGRAMVEHRVCIDLPGEPVECWAETDVTVLLRKHRDVIFDLAVKPGATYTVEAPEDWFYDVTKKKRVKQGQFSDGQRYHIWISRDFKGYLLLKQNGKELQRYSMFQFGLSGGNSDPKVKPEPIIIAMHVDPRGGAQRVAATPLMISGALPITDSQSLFDFANPTDASLRPLAPPQQWCPLPVHLAKDTPVESPQQAHVVEVDKQSIPHELLDQVAAGGSAETAIDTNKIATRNWLLGQFAGMAAFVSDNKEWIRELWSEKFRLTKIVHKRVGERWYVVFTGNPRSRELITAARYGVKHEKVLTIAGGAGSVESGIAAAWEGTKGTLKKAGLIALIFTITLDTAEWLHDYQQVGADGKPKRDFADLLGKIGIDFAKAGLSAAIASSLVGLAVALLAGVIALPVAAIVVGTLVVAVIVGYGLDLLDQKMHITDHAISGIRSLGGVLKRSADYLEEVAKKDYLRYSTMFVR
jgi:hypothetical protein